MRFPHPASCGKEAGNLCGSCVSEPHPDKIKCEYTPLCTSFMHKFLNLFLMLYARNKCKYYAKIQHAGHKGNIRSKSPG
jgi:hypothetical protein